MSKRNHHRRASFGNSRLGALERTHTCNGGCGVPVPEESGTLSYCGTCWRVSTVLSKENCEHVTELARFEPRHTRGSLLARVSDLLRRTGVDDAETLIRQIEQRLA